MRLLFFNPLCNFTILGDREWIPDHSVKCKVLITQLPQVFLKFAQKPSARTQQKTGKINVRLPCHIVAQCVYQFIFLVLLYQAPENLFYQLFNSFKLSGLFFPKPKPRIVITPLKNINFLQSQLFSATVYQRMIFLKCSSG